MIVHDSCQRKHEQYRALASIVSKTRSEFTATSAIPANSCPTTRFVADFDFQILTYNLVPQHVMFGTASTSHCVYR